MTLAHASHAQLESIAISVRVVQLLMAAVEQTGVQRAEIMRVLGSSSVALDDGDGWITNLDAERVCELALALSGDPALGLRWAEGLTERTFGPVSHLVQYAGSLRAGLAQISAFERLFCNRAFFSLSESGDQATLRLFPSWSFGSTRTLQFAAEMAVAGLLVVLRLFNPKPESVRVCFSYPAPAHHVQYTRVLGPNVHFDQRFDGLVFERALLDRASQYADSDIQAAMQVVAERRLLRVTEGAPGALRVSEVLKLQAAARPNMSSVAATLGVTVKALRRQLKKEGVSYREVEHAALASHAQSLLCNERLSIQETAYAMGFSDAATFHRAVKQWVGKTPSELRASRHGGQRIG